jgi:Methyltransferase domain
VSNKEQARAITGKISASPNPISFGQNCVVISWETNDPAGAEVRVSTAPGEEKLVSQGQSGQTEIPWIVGATIYDFRLYAASQLETPVDSVQVRRDLESAPMALRELADEALRGNIDMAELSRFIATVIPVCLRSTAFRAFLPVVLREVTIMRETIDIMELSQFVGAVMGRCLHSRKFPEIFPTWEQQGFHVTPVHFYQPIPDTQRLPETLWNKPSELVGLDMNDPVQLDLLRKRFSKFRDEYEQFPTRPTGQPSRFYLNNNFFDGTDALVAYCMVRHFQPRLIIEVGSGFSSLTLGEAAAKNGSSVLICIEPFPQEFLKQSFPGLHSLIEKRVEDIELEFFSQLGSGDILFIDSSHTVKIGGDVNYLFLEVLPRLKPGVIVHVHDIFFPFDYRRDWVLDELRFWTEQYLLQAFLTFNSEFEVLMSNSYLSQYYSDNLKVAFPSLSSWGGGSFWMRRRLSSKLKDHQSFAPQNAIPG